jgi:hypothetical protein
VLGTAMGEFSRFSRAADCTTSRARASLAKFAPAAVRAAGASSVFHHSRLLESVKLNDKSGGSLTSLPIIETQAGDLSASPTKSSRYRRSDLE